MQSTQSELDANAQRAREDHVNESGDEWLVAEAHAAPSLIILSL